MSSDTAILDFGGKGMNSALNAFLLDAAQVQRAVNCRLSQQMWRTRYGVRTVALTGLDKEVAAYRAGNTQGAIYYNPARGQGALVFADDLAQIAESSAGQMFALRPAGENSLRVIDISNGLRNARHLHLAWLCQAENYLIRTDGVGKTWVHDGTTAEFSPGYIGSGSSREASRIPNRAGPMVYAHARLHVVVDGRKILVGDALHRLNLSSPVNILQFTEQTYWATGQYFSPPSAMGAILSAAVLPMQDTNHGHAEAMFHCDNGGVFSVNTNVHPRSAWAEQSLSRHALLSTGAAGPYALILSDGDQLFRSRKGIQSLRSAASERNVVGSPYANLAAEVKTFMRGDREEDLRFASLVRWERQERILCTVYPVVDGRFRWHRGFVVSNMLPTEARPDVPPAWEGLWTLPAETGGVTQFVAGIFDGKERLFALCWNPCDETKRVVEFDENTESDWLEDGTESRISCQIVTRHLLARSLFHTAQVSEGFLHLGDVKTDIDWGVWYRFDNSREWLRWRCGSAKMPAGDPWQENSGIPDGPRSLGPAPSAKGFHSVQFLIRWRGAASVQFMIRHTDPKRIDGADKLPVPSACINYDDYEYNSPGCRWENGI